MLKILILLTVVITVAALITWQVTGGDYYTKFEVIEQVDKPVASDDPLAEAGFYEGANQTETIATKDFRFGLLPTAQTLLDKHVLSVMSVSLPFWVFSFIVFWWTWRKERRMARQPLAG